MKNLNETRPRDMYVVMYKDKENAKNRNVAPTQVGYKSESDAKKFLKSIEKDGGVGMIVPPRKVEKNPRITDSVNESKVINKTTGKDITQHVLDLLKGKIDKKQFEKLTGLKKEEVVKMNESNLTEGSNNIGHYERVGNQTIVDSNFVNLSKGMLPDSQLVHLGMGDFALKTPEGEIKFLRSGKLVGIGQDFVGRPHRLTDDKNGKLIEKLLKIMTKKKRAVLSMSESVNESAGKEAMGIAALTGTRGDAVQKFIDDFHLNARKLFLYLKKKGFEERMDFMTAIAGKPGNKYQGEFVGMFGESKINESKKSVSKLADELSKVSAEMKKHAGYYTKAKDASEKKKHLEHLKGLTSKKKELEKAIDNAIGDLDKDVELAQNEHVLRSFIRKSIRENLNK